MSDSLLKTSINSCISYESRMAGAVVLFWEANSGSETDFVWAPNLFNTALFTAGILEANSAQDNVS